MEQQPIFTLLGLIAGMLFGGFVVWWALRGAARAAEERARAEMAAEQATLVERLDAREQRIAALAQEREQLVQDAGHLREKNSQLQTEMAALQTCLAERGKAMEEKLALLDEAQARLSDAFKALSTDALQSNNRAFLDLARATLEKYQEGAQTDLGSRQKAIEQMVAPLREALGKVDSNLQEMEKARAADYASVTEQVKNLREVHDLLRSETSNLVNALRAPAVRGRWGEIQLRRVVEMAGMVEYCDFDEQASVDTEDGRLRPDLVIHLPNGREVVVDAKVSLDAYLQAIEAGDEQARAQKMKEHAAQIRSHLQRLGGKRYWTQFESAPEFVVAFLPGEVFFSAALEQDPGLIEHGVEHKVLLATPTTLIALLKAVAYGWRQEKLAESAQKISELGRLLHRRLEVFTKYLEEIRRGLERAVDGYNRAVGSFESRVLISARKFQDLGAATKGELPRLAPVDRALRPVEGEEKALAAGAGTVDSNDAGDEPVPEQNSWQTGDPESAA